MAVLLAATGCSDQRAPVARQRVTVDVGEAEPAVVAGDLLQILREGRTTDAPSKSKTLRELFLGPDVPVRAGLLNPQGMAVHGDRLLVCDQGRPDVVAVDRTTGKVKLWGHEDHRPRCPVDVAVDGAGNVFIADADAAAVLAFDAGAGFIESIALPHAGEALARPVAVCCDAEVVYVGDVESRQVHRWSRGERAWLAPLGPLLAPGIPLQAPTGLALDPAGRLLVVDALQRHLLRVDVENNERIAVEVLGRPGRGLGEFVRPKQVCVMADGRMLVTDAGRQSVLLLAPDGQYLAEIHETEGWPGWTLPAGLLVTGWSAGTDPAGPPSGEPGAGTWLIVSDALGVPSLTLVVLPDAQ